MVTQRITWISAHVYLTGTSYGEAGDSFIKDAVAPIVENVLASGLTRRFFFIRYSSDGPHIRLRIRTEDSEAEEAVREVLAAICPRLRWVPYEPEYRRYGGAAAMQTGEHCFDISSRAAIRVIQRLDSSNQPARLGKALLATLIAIHTFLPEQENAVQFANVYCNRNISGFAREEAVLPDWKRAFDEAACQQEARISLFVDTAWSKLCLREPLEILEFDQYAADMSLVKEELNMQLTSNQIFGAGLPLRSMSQVTQLIVPSYIHMMNNRLGITLREEAYLSHIIARTLAGAPAVASQ